MKEAIYIKLEWLSLNRGGGLLHHLSTTNCAVLGFLPRQINPILSLTHVTPTTHIMAEWVNDKVITTLTRVIRGGSLRPQTLLQVLQLKKPLV